MKKKQVNENNGFQSEINSASVNEKVNGLVNDSLTVLAETTENTADFLLPESVEIGAPTNISATEEKPAGDYSGSLKLSPDLEMIPNAFNIDIQLVEPHSQVMKVRKEKDLSGLKLTMRLKGLLEPIKVVCRNKRFQIVDGISRYFAALELGWKTITVIIVNLSDEEIQEQYVFRNYRTKRSFEEMTNHAEVILGVLGISQGKKRERIGGLELGDDNYTLVGKDRFEIACDIMGIDISASSLRRSMQIGRAHV